MSTNLHASIREFRALGRDINERLRIIRKAVRQLQPQRRGELGAELRRLETRMRIYDAGALDRLVLVAMQPWGVDKLRRIEADLVRLEARIRDEFTSALRPGA